MTKINFFRKNLIEERIKIEKMLDRMENHGIEGFSDEYTTELSLYDNHPADLGTEMFIKEQDEGIISQFKNILDKIDTSLEDLEKGNYGICKRCRRQINEERLKLVPYLKYCIDCADTEEYYESAQRAYRPIEERVYESLKKGIDESIEFDREDAYQAVARYNMIDADPSFSTGDNLGIYDEGERGVVEDIEKFSNQSNED